MIQNPIEKTLTALHYGWKGLTAARDYVKQTVDEFRESPYEHGVKKILTAIPNGLNAGIYCANRLQEKSQKVSFATIEYFLDINFKDDEWISTKQKIESATKLATFATSIITLKVISYLMSQSIISNTIDNITASSLILPACLGAVIVEEMQIEQASRRIKAMEQLVNFYEQQITAAEKKSGPRDQVAENKLSEVKKEKETMASSLDSLKTQYRQQIANSLLFLVRSKPD